MYSCVLNETNAGAVLLKNNEEVAKLKLRFMNEVVYVDVESMDRELVAKDEETSRTFTKFAFYVCKKVEESLQGKGVHVNKAVFGTIADVAALDEYLSELETFLSKESYDKIKGKSPTMR